MDSDPIKWIGMDKTWILTRLSGSEMDFDPIKWIEPGSNLDFSPTFRIENGF